MPKRHNTVDGTATTARGRPRRFDTDAVLDAALLAFWETGFAGTSYGDLVAATGVNRPSLYAAFGDKEALFEAALDRYFKQYGVPALDRIAAGDGDARGAIGAWLEASAAGLADPGHPPGCLVVRTVAECPGDRSGAKRARACMAMTEEALYRRLERGRAAGEIDAETDLRTLARTLAAAHAGMSTAARAGATAKELRAVARTVARLIPVSGADGPA